MENFLEKVGLDLNWMPRSRRRGRKGSERMNGLGSKGPSSERDTEETTGDKSKLRSAQRLELKCLNTGEGPILSGENFQLHSGDFRR